MDENLELTWKMFYLVEQKHGIVIEEELVEDERKKGKHLFNSEVIILKPFQLRGTKDRDKKPMETNHMYKSGRKFVSIQFLILFFITPPPNYNHALDVEI